MSEGGLHCDLRRQLDEISALESIFTDSELKRSEEHGPSAGQLYALVEVPTDFSVVSKHRESKKEEILAILFLPPIVLHYSLPEKYPSNPKSQPSFTLTCHWLNRMQLSKLCRRLDSLWQENLVDGQGTEILFTWAHFLKNESLEFLKIQNCIDITPIENIHCSRYMLHSVKPSSGVIVPEENQSTLSNLGNPSVEDLGVAVRMSSKESHTEWIFQEPSGGNSTWTCLPRNVAKETPVLKKHDTTPISRRLDCRAVVDLGINVSLMEFLDSYNKTQQNLNFCQQVHLCDICCGTKLGFNFMKFVPCGHIFCIECCKTHFSTCISDGKVQNILCLGYKCNSEAQFNQIKELVSCELFFKYDRLLLEATLNELGDIITCPRQACQYSVIRDGDGKLATCFQCRYAFCVECRMGYHGVDPCRFKASEEHHLVEEYREASEQRRLELEKRYSKRRLEELVQNTMTKEWIDDNSKNCPHCRASIQKSFGCNKMVCLKCNTNFCWLCAAKLDPMFPYLHFNKTGSTCYNLLFQGVEINNEDIGDELGGDDWYFEVEEEPM